MKQNFNLVTLQIRLLFLTVLLTVAGFALVSQFADTSSYIDDSARVRVLQVQEFNGDSEPPLDSQPLLDALVLSLLLFYACALILMYSRPKNITTSLRYLNHVRPRSPPTH